MRASGNTPIQKQNVSNETRTCATFANTDVLPGKMIPATMAALWQKLPCSATNHLRWPAFHAPVGNTDHSSLHSVCCSQYHDPFGYAAELQDRMTVEPFGSYSACSNPIHRFMHQRPFSSQVSSARPSIGKYEFL